MRKKIHLPSYIKNSYFFILSATLLLVLSCGFWGISLLNTLHTRELSQIGSIAGTILTEYPEAEEILVSALQDIEENHLDKGFSILAKYGYRKNILMMNDPYYRSTLSSFTSLLSLAFFCCLALISLLFLHFYRSQKNQEMQLHSLLERYLSEDYSGLKKELSSGSVFSESFTDTLYKLGNKLMTKTWALAKERDNTKTLVTDISHQLKTPISALKSCFSMCMEAETEAERNDFLERCALQMNRLESLVTALVNISRLETSLITLHPEETLLSDILMNAVNTIYEKALQKNITIELDDSNGEDAASLSLLLDKKWTTEAIANILDNAVKYSPAGSTIALHLRQFYSYVRIEIEDEGIGIPKTEYNQIFKRFYRGSDPAVKQSEGSGVGLYLSRRIIEEQNGTVMVKPAVKQGSIFVVQLPL